MPNITFSYNDFQKLLGTKLQIEKFRNLLLLYAKAELGKQEADEVTVELDDTNLPYLWCPEGLARLFKGVLGISKGTAKLKLSKSEYKIIADDSVKAVRPFITAFVAKGKKLDDYTLKQIIQMQEKFCENYGRRRQKVSIGLYSYKRLTFPIHYKAVEPESAKFIPLEFEKALNLKQILEQHPKGQQYGWILKNAEKYPLLSDSNGEVLSFPPIINSNFTGRLEIGDSELLFEATGTDEESINLSACIFAQNLQERGFQIYSVIVKQGQRTIATPIITRESLRINPSEVRSLTGLELTQQQIQALLEKTGYDVKGNLATVPHYRADVMHPFDIIEDVAISFGFDKIEELPLASYTVGKKEKSSELVNSLRKAVSGMGFQEIFSHILADKNSISAKMGIGTQNIIELENFMSETYSAVRNSILPQLLEVLSKNKHSEYPQKLFEEGTIADRQGSKISEQRSICLVFAHSKANFTEAKQYLVSLLSIAGVKSTILPKNEPHFIGGRSGSIVSGGKQIGSIGEISPRVLAEFGIEMPTVAIEIGLSFLL